MIVLLTSGQRFPYDKNSFGLSVRRPDTNLIFRPPSDWPENINLSSIYRIMKFRSITVKSRDWLSLVPTRSAKVENDRRDRFFSISTIVPDPSR